VADALEGAPGADAAMDALETALAPHLARAPQPDPLVAAAVAEIRRAVARGARPRHGEPNASAARRLRRRFAAAVGYGPKTFERVVRFQRFRALARREGGRTLGLADLAAACGYADQAHLARECRRLAGLPPAALRAFASETFKTARRDPATLGA
jgi:transcriptional regulator GlxA family with amidase domain